MQVWLLDYDKFIKANGLKEVTNPIMFDSGNVPSEGGLFSTSIFGTSSRERKETFAYINLGQHYLNPKVYIALKRLNRKFESVIYGTKTFSIDKSGVLVEDDNGGTGIEWLYNNWDKIKFEKNDSAQRAQRIDLLKNNPKDIVFTNKFIVIPAFYRDINIQSSSDKVPKVPDINKLYANIIRNVNSIKDANTMKSVLLSMSGKIQDLIVEIYNMLKDKIQGKYGYIRQSLMGKSIDYCSRVVITGTPYVSNSYTDQNVNYYYTGIPLAQVCAEFTPFIIFWLKTWFKNNLENQANSFIIFDKNNEKQIVKLDNPSAYYNEDYIEHNISNFIKNPYSRFDKIVVPVLQTDKDRLGMKTDPYYEFIGMSLQGENINTVPEMKPNVRRPMTWTDLLYCAAVDVTSDKHVWITRYPVLDYMGTYTSRISILSTRQTVPMMLNGHLYKHYPVVDLNAKQSEMDVLFRDTVNVCALYLAGLGGGDFDGETKVISAY